MTGRLESSTRMPGVPDNDDATGWQRTPRSTPALLDEIVRCSLDPAYSEAAGKRSGQPGTLRRARAASLLAVAVAGLLVATAAHRQAVHGPEQSRARAALATDIEAETADTRELAARATRLDEENRTARERQGPDTAEAAELTGRIATLAPVVGQVGLRGPGVQVRITDAPAGRGNPGAGRVLDQDIAELVNVLWAAGAEAAVVSGVRLTALTAIRSAGDTVLVGFHPLASPYVIEAIGDAERLSGAVASSMTTARLRAVRAEFGGELVISAMREITVAPAPVTTLEHAGESTP